jgi:glycine betaine/proline transport system substrate-binding protein
MSNISFKTETMSSLLSWQDANNATAEEAAVYYLQNNKDEWSAWLNDDARAKLSALLK